MSNSSLISGFFCFFSALSEGLFCYTNAYLNSGPFSVKNQFQTVLWSRLVWDQCLSNAYGYKSMSFQLDPLRGIFSVLGSSRWRPLQGCPNLVTVSLNCLSEGTDMATASCTLFSY